MIEEIFERFCQAEFHTDWDNGLAQWGDRMNPGLLDRTAAQRRFDALLAVFTSAAGSGVVGRFDPLVNINVDQTTLEHHLARLAGADPEPLDPATCGPDATYAAGAAKPTTPNHGPQQRTNRSEQRRTRLRPP